MIGLNFALSFCLFRFFLHAESPAFVVILSMYLCCLRRSTSKSRLSNEYIDSPFVAVFLLVAQSLSVSQFNGHAEPEHSIQTWIWIQIRFVCLLYMPSCSLILILVLVVVAAAVVVAMNTWFFQWLLSTHKLFALKHCVPSTTKNKMKIKWNMKQQRSALCKSD